MNLNFGMGMGMNMNMNMNMNPPHNNITATATPQNNANNTQNPHPNQQPPNANGLAQIQGMQQRQLHNQQHLQNQNQNQNQSQNLNQNQNQPMVFTAHPFFNSMPLNTPSGPQHITFQATQMAPQPSATFHPYQFHPNNLSAKPFMNHSLPSGPINNPNPFSQPNNTNFMAVSPSPLQQQQHPQQRPHPNQGNIHNNQQSFNFTQTMMPPPNSTVFITPSANQLISGTNPSIPGIGSSSAAIASAIATANTSGANITIPSTNPSGGLHPPPSPHAPAITAYTASTNSRKRIPPEKTLILENAFQDNPKPDKDARNALAKETDLPVRNIQVCFKIFFFLRFFYFFFSSIYANLFFFN